MWFSAYPKRRTGLKRTIVIISLIAILAVCLIIAATVAAIGATSGFNSKQTLHLHGFGDSVTYGLCDGSRLPEEQRYLAKLTSPLKGNDWTVVYNHAISGSLGPDMCNQILIDGASRRVVMLVTLTL